MPSAEDEFDVHTTAPREASDSENDQSLVDPMQDRIDTFDEPSTTSENAVSEESEYAVSEESSDDKIDSSLSSFPEEDSASGSPRDQGDPVNDAARELALARLKAETLQIRGTVENQFWPLLHETKSALEHSREDVRMLEAELARLREFGVELSIDYEKIADACRESERRSADADGFIDALDDRLKQAHELAAEIEKSTLERSSEVARALEGELARLRELGTRLTADYEMLADTCRESERRSGAASASIDAIGERLTKTAQAHELAAQVESSTLERSRDAARALELELARLREQGLQLTADYERIGDTCRESERRSAVAAASIEAIEDRLARSTQAYELAEQIDAKLDTLRALAHEVDRAFCAVTAHKERIAEDLAEARRIADLAWDVDERMVKLEEHDRRLSKAEHVVGRLATRANDAITQFEQQLGALEGRRQQVDESFAAVARLDDLVSSLEARTKRLGEHAAVLSRDEQPSGRSTGVGGKTQMAPLVTTAKLHVGRIHRGLIDAAQWIRRIPVAPARVRMTREWALGLVGVAALTLFVLWQHESSDPAMARQREAVAQSVLVSRSLTPAQFTIPRLASARLSDSSAGQATGAARYAQFAAQGPDSAAGRPQSSRKPRPTVVRLAPPMPGAQATNGVTDSATESFIGDLSVQSEPSGAVVFVNGRRVGETPLEITRLRAGSHLLRMERRGYDPWTASVLVTANRRTPVSARLQPDSGR
jgi:hypothetical protein